MLEAPSKITIRYNSQRLTGSFVRDNSQCGLSFWERLKARVLEKKLRASVSEVEITVPWQEVLGVVREFGTRSIQRTLNFRFILEGEAETKIKSFISEIKLTKSVKATYELSLTESDISSKLIHSGFTKRTLKDFQIRDLIHLTSLPHGANFSVPGAGKTTVTFALHILTRQNHDSFFVICPKAAFPAWKSIVQDCMQENSPDDGCTPFQILDGSEADTEQKLRSGATRFIMSYDLLIRQQSLITLHVASVNTHMVLDESHRMKAGLNSQRGAFLLNIAPLLIRRDILSGTPMPQSASDLASQLGFLFPGHGLDLQIQRGAAPRDVLGSLYVRTTKQELGLPPSRRRYYQVDMASGQKALYAIVRNEVVRKYANISQANKNIDFLSARKSVMRLLQISTNPIQALHGMSGDNLEIDSGVVNAVVEEGASTKARAVVDHARQLAREGKKVVIWTIFTKNILDLEDMLVDLNPVSIYGAVPSGDDNDISTREGRLNRFHVDDACKVLIANPAAAGEGISLHTICHDAIYLDRSYVSTHYLQSIDRIHRLGLSPDVETNIHIYQTKAPATLGSVDLSVSRRLALKIRNLQQLLDDPDLHEIALDEENADDPIDYDMDLQDLIDLISELEGKVFEQTDEA